MSLTSPLISRRYRRHRRPDLDSPFWWAAALGALINFAFILLIASIVTVASACWLLVALTVAIVAALRGNADLAGTMDRSLHLFSWFDGVLGLEQVPFKRQRALKRSAPAVAGADLSFRGWARRF